MANELHYPFRFVTSATTAPITTTPAPVSNDPFQISVTYAAAPVNPTASYPLLKYNKRVALHLTADDGGAVDYQVIPNILNAVTGYTDGTGKALKPGFTYALTSLINGRLDRDNTSNSEITTWAQYRTLLSQRNIGYSNHSSLHSPYDAANPSTLPATQIADAESMIYDRLGIILRTVTIPGGFDGFVDGTMSKPTYLGMESQGYGPDGSYAGSYVSQIRWEDKVSIPYTPPAGKFILSRYFINQDWGTPTKAWFDSKMAVATNEYNQGLRTVLSAFDHFPSTQAANFAAFLQYTQTHPLNVGGDSIWYCNFQEFLEYEEMKRLCPVSAPSVSGNTVTWTINRSALPSVNLYQDASLLLTGGTITNVTVTGGDSFTVNNTTGLLNISKIGAPTYTVAAPIVLPTPNAPTVAFNTTTRVLSATASGYTTSQLEYRHGQTATVVAYADVTVDGAVHDANEWQFRVKASATNQASAWAGNAFIAGTANTDVPVAGNDNDPTFAVWNSQAKTTGKVPLLAKYIYWSNNYHDVGFDAWVDGSLAPYYGGAFKYQDPYSQANARVVVDVRAYRWKASYIEVVYRQATNNPIVVKYIAKGTFSEVTLGEIPNQLGPTRLRLTFPTSTDVTSLVFYSKNGSDMVSELELYGDYIVPVPPSPVIKRAAIKEMLTTNFFQWDYLQSDSPADVSVSKAAQMTQYNGGRWYADRIHCNPLENVFMFGPSSNEYGSWNWDHLAQYLHDRNIDFRICIKNQPPHIVNTYPSDYQTSEQKPVKWQGDVASTIAWAKQPEAYRELGQLWWQLVARWGSKVWPLDQLNVFQKADKSFPHNEKLTGMGWLKRIEAGNEHESWWRGLMGSMSSPEIAAMLSCLFDGHMGTMGPGVGAVVADPSISFSIGGFAIATIETLKGIVDWCRQNRGYNADGTVNVPFHILNIHFYANDGGSLQIGNITRGMCPEKAGILDKANEFIAFSAEYLGNMPVIFGEWGYDVSEFSSQAAVRPVDLLRDGNGNIMYDKYQNRLLIMGPDRKQRELTQAAWSLRTAEIFALGGIAESNNYMDKDASFPASEYSRYSACGMTNFDGSRRPAGNFFYQVLHLMPNYIVTSSATNDTKWITYKTDPKTNKTAEAWWVPDEVGRTESHTFTVTQTSSLCTLNPYSTYVNIEVLAPGTYTRIISETPMYLMRDQIILSDYTSTTDAGSYYVSDTAGNDANNGTTPATAFKTIAKVNSLTLAAGNRVWFEGGSTFAGSLLIKDSGTVDKPIRIGSYGTGRATISSGTLDGIAIRNASYVEVHDLAFVGGGSAAANQAVGIHWFSNVSNAVLRGVVLHNNVVSGYHLEGILAETTTGTLASALHDFVATYNDVHDCGQAGISSRSGDNLTPIFKNYQVSHNHVYNITGRADNTTTSSGNGIILFNVDGATVEYNTAHNTGGIGGWTGGGPHAISVALSNSVTMQFNEAYATATSTGISGGGFGILRGSTKVTVQYCYSHDNQGAGYQVSTNSTAVRASTGNIVRYNIGYNDATTNDTASVVLGSGTNQNTTQFYNNVVINKSGKACIRLYGEGLATSAIANNIFVREGAGSALVTTGSNLVPTTQLVNNLYYQDGAAITYAVNGATYTGLAALRTGTSQEMYNGQATGVEDNPNFVTGTRGGTIGYEGNLKTLLGYKLQNASPARNKQAADMPKPFFDYFGRSVSDWSNPTNIGIDQSQVPAT
jgi:hypothetical protein